MAAAVAARTNESIASFFRIECLSFREGSPLGSGLPGFAHDSDNSNLERSRSHSLRIASIGSTFAARRAGSQVARRATAASSAAMLAKVSGSRALTP